ncbi:MAG: N(2)-acetyl-L-2,4-diaminobutanoate deacetylase DoeB [Alphaproteobacteria bacterium]|nr:N(2)-acetyl-L-2,4-diaminobutanoate deacetylase DoeB [Alphaproteobacteria bacterium]
MSSNPISSTVDFERDGVQHGFLKLPHSHDGSAWGSIMIPVTVIKNGDGPTALLTGGNHGDEYEGPLALYDLVNTIGDRDVTGRVIVVPVMNVPAFHAGRRTSPIDGVNLNRAFPGNPLGTATQKLADYFQRTLLPMADYVLDFHSGGKTLDFVPFCASHVLADKANEERCALAMRAFNAPYSVTLLEVDNVGMYDTAAEEMGKVFVSTELGGGGTARAETVAVARKGTRNFLRHAGILGGALEQSATIDLDMPDGRCFVESRSVGLLELCVELGDRVSAGQCLARIHDIHQTGGLPVEYHSQLDGIFIGRHFPGLIAMGDIIAVIAVPV